jgi:small subunit ribosomal protein S5
MAETLDATSSLESTTVGVYRTAATVKGGRRFSFSALVVVGDRQGRVGIGYGKANQVPQAIEKAQKIAKRKMQEFPMVGHTIPHTVTGRFGACLVRLLPASPGTGVIAGAAVRAPLEMMGIQDCLTKSFGATNPKNLVKAVMNGLSQLRTKEQVERLRGVEIGMTEVEEAIERGQHFMPTTTGGEKAAAPVNVVGDKAGRGGRRGGGGRPGRGRRGPDKTGDSAGGDSGSGSAS